jgi:hypothetical protein
MAGMPLIEFARACYPRWYVRARVEQFMADNPIDWEGIFMKSKRFENSPADKREDKASAKKHGMTLGKYERSAIDKKADAKGQAKLDAAGRAKARAVGGKK